MKGQSKEAINLQTIANELYTILCYSIETGKEINVSAAELAWMITADHEDEKAVRDVGVLLKKGVKLLADLLASIPEPELSPQK